MRIAYLPLDSRPCNAVFPGQLARWSGHSCVVPDKREMDHFAKPARYEDTLAFLERSAPEADALVIAIDHLCFGSLLASRQDDTTLSEAEQRLAYLRQLHERYPQLPIYAYSIMMRSSISTLAAGDWAVYEAMTEYSVYSDRADRYGQNEDRVKAEAARIRIPQDVLERYKRVRQRNHEINRKCLQMTSEGVFASLALLQEDSQTYGFHKQEQRILAEECSRLQVQNVWIRNGADECGSLTVMKAISRNKPIELDVVWLGEEDWVALYEDRPFSDNVNNSIAETGLHVVGGAHSVLAICCPPEGKQTDYMEEECTAQINEQAAALARMIEAGKDVYLLDVRQANGGSYSLLKALYEISGGLNIAGYSAWNTASNSLGTALAQIISDQLAGRVNRSFLAERVLDDMVYQRIVRTELEKTLRQRGEDPFHLHEPERVQEEMQTLFRRMTEGERMLDSLPAYQVSFPWSRTFEVFVQTEQENTINEQHAV